MDKQSIGNWKSALAAHADTKPNGAVAMSQSFPNHWQGDLDISRANIKYAARWDVCHYDR